MGSGTTSSMADSKQPTLREKIEGKVYEALPGFHDIDWDGVMHLVNEAIDAEKVSTVTHIMSAKTEGLFDRGELFIKRQPIEQAMIDVIGYDAFKAIQESLPKANPTTVTEQYQCPSYFDDNGVLQNCKCGKCR